MFKSHAIDYFGSKSKLAKAAGVKLPSIYKWGDLVPEGRATRLETASGGALKYDPAVYDQHKAKRLKEMNHENQQLP